MFTRHEVDKASEQERRIAMDMLKRLTLRWWKVIKAYERKEITSTVAIKKATEQLDAFGAECNERCNDVERKLLAKKEPKR